MRDKRRAKNSVRDTQHRDKRRSEQPLPQRDSSVRIRVGDIFEACAIDMAHDGRAVVKHPEGQVIFVSGLCLDELARCRITHLKGRSGSAELLEILSLSPHRVNASCQYHGHSDSSCGGCPWMFIDYEEQLRIKHQKIQRALDGLGLSFVVAPLQGSPLQSGYRNRAQFKTDGHVLGFFAASSHRIIDVENCEVLNQKNQETLAFLRQQLPQPEWRHKAQRKPKHARWVEIEVDDVVPVEVSDIESKPIFRQGNDAQNTRMRQWLAQRCDAIQARESVLELFCGAGNFTEILLEKKFKKVIAAECDTRAIKKLKDSFSNLANSSCELEAVVANLFDGNALEQLLMKSKAKVLVCDPPRAGIKHEAFHQQGSSLQKRIRKGVEHVLYVSCDLATFVRDLKVFLGLGFTLKNMEALDQFPHTPHIELLAHLQK